MRSSAQGTGCASIVRVGVGAPFVSPGANRCALPRCPLSAGSGAPGRTNARPGPAHPPTSRGFPPPAPPASEPAARDPARPTAGSLRTTALVETVRFQPSPRRLERQKRWGRSAYSTVLQRPRTDVRLSIRRTRPLGEGDPAPARGGKPLPRPLPNETPASTEAGEAWAGASCRRKPRPAAKPAAPERPAPAAAPAGPRPVRTAREPLGSARRRPPARGAAPPARRRN